MIQIVKRSRWKALKPRANIIRHVPDKITVHHQGPLENYPTIHQIPCFDGDSTIRMLQKLDIYAKGLVDIAYHFVVAPDGSIYEGRDVNSAGAHTKSNHSGNVGILFIGNFNVEKPTEEQMSAFNLLLAWLGFVYPQIRIPQDVFTHRELNFVDCPGRYLHDIIIQMKFETKKETI
jgi:hypothetical protein